MKEPESARTALGLPHHLLPRLTKFPLAVISESVVITIDSKITHARTALGSTLKKMKISRSDDWASVRHQ